MADKRGWDLCPVSELEEHLATSGTTGLTAEKAAAKLERDGKNELEKKKPPSLAMLFVAQLINVIMLLLIASATASLTIAAAGSESDDIKSYVEGIAIFVIVILNAGIAAVTENVANNALEALSKMSQPQCTVIRDGVEQKIESTHVVAGDLLVLNVGDIVAADCRVIESAELKVNEMLLTGEPDDVAKTHKTSKKEVKGNLAKQLIEAVPEGAPLQTDTITIAVDTASAEGGLAPRSPCASPGGKSDATPANKPADVEEKLTPSTMAFSSCLVTNGKAKAIVSDTGMNTRVGAIAKLLDQGGNTQTPLQVSLQELGVKIGYLAIFVCGTVWLVGTILGRKDENDREKSSALYMTLVAVTLAVAAIPEGIPLCVTISLSNGCNAMVKRNVLVRRLAAVETLGSASVICTDKTGTLTEGKMTMVKMWSANILYNISGQGFDPTSGKVYPAKQGQRTISKKGFDALEAANKKSSEVSGEGAGVGAGEAKDSGGSHANISSTPAPISSTPSREKYELRATASNLSLADEALLTDSGKTEPTVRSTLLAGLLCSNTSIAKDPESGLWKPKGNSSEAPIVVAAAKVGFWLDDIEKSYERIVEIPFNSTRKMMVVVLKLNENVGSTFGPGGIPIPEGTKYCIIVKGAPNIIIDVCKYKCVRDGVLAPFTEEDRLDVMEVVDSLSSQALRVLAIAIRFLPSLPFDEQDSNLTSDDKFQALLHGAHSIRIMGLVASIDPPREGVLQAVEAANGGGIRVVMITGDYYKTAMAIARDVNILKPNDDTKKTALDCTALRPGGDGQYLPDDELDDLTSKVKVFARAKPEDKLEIVKSLQRQGLVSAMTGDGVNDAPALKQSDIGVAMGIQGTDVAKGAADMILTDDNFVSIVGAVEKGRVIYAGIQKFVAFIMSVHIGEVMQIFFCVVVNIPIMRQPLQILFLILVTDLPPAVALGMEPGSATIMKDKPRPKTQPIVLKWMWISIVVNGAILSVVVAVVYLLCLQHYIGELSGTKIADAISAEDLLEEITGSRGANIQLELVRARTATFVCVVFAENVRAYTSRSFDQPFFIDLCSNVAMQKAIAMAQTALWLVIFVSGISDEIFGLQGQEVDAVGYILALCGAFACLVLCEIYKFIAKKHIVQQNQKVEEERVRRECLRLQRLSLKNEEGIPGITPPSAVN